MNSSADWVLQVDPNVWKIMRTIPRPYAERILLAIRNKKVNPYTDDIQKMKGEKDVWRQRIGPYRIFYEVVPELKIVHVYDLERRGSKTYRKRR